jgi:hypothetical protein
VTRRRGLLLGIALSAGATPAAGQLAGTLDMGAGTYRPDRAIPGGIASIVPSLRYQRGPLELSAIGVYSDAPAGRWNFQGGTAALLRTPTFGILHLEAIGQAEWTAHYRVRGTTLFTGGVGAYIGPGSGARAWVGRYRGQATSLGTRRPLQRSEIGGSARVGPVQLEFSVANTTVDRSLLFEPTDPRQGSDTLTTGPIPDGPAPTSQKRVERVALTDAVLSGRWRINAVDFDVTLGRRFSRTTPETTIWGLSASRGIAPSLALVAAAGRSGSDPVTSVPGARYFALGLRLQVGSPGAPSLPAPTAASARAPFRIGPAVGADREIVIQAANVRGVELAGDFTDWKPVSLRRWGNHSWRAVLPISSGLHRLAIRIDGGAWQAPPGTRPIPSEFGGEVAEIVVE